MDKVKIGIVGTGSISNFHMVGYNNIKDKAEVVACCDLNIERAKEWAKRYGIDEKNVFGSVEEMCANTDIDAVSVTCWNNGHAPSAIAALKAGKNVLCEKPLAMSAKEGIEMKKAAEESGKLLMVGFVRRFWQNADIFNSLNKDNELLGNIYYAKTTCLRRVGNPCGWFSDKKRSGGGPLIDLGVHVIDLARYLMGNPKPVAVSGQTYSNMGPKLNVKEINRYVPADPSDFCDVEDLAVATIRFENGAVLHAEAAFTQNIGEDELTVNLYGDKGGATYEPQIKISTEKNNHLIDIIPKYDATPDPFGYGFTKEIEHYIDCIRTGAPCRNTADDGIAIAKILDAIYESSEKGREVEINWD